MTTWSDRAEAYRESPTHREGPDLDLVVEWCDPGEGVKALGLELLCQDERFASDTVTAIKCPEGVEVSALRNAMEDDYNVVIAGGQAKLQGKIFRIGHLGLVEEEDIRETLRALEQTLAKLGFKAAAVR